MRFRKKIRLVLVQKVFDPIPMYVFGEIATLFDGALHYAKLLSKRR